MLVWQDAESNSGDHELKEVIEDPLPWRRTIGFLAHEDEDQYVLVGTDDRFSPGVEKEMIGDAFRIPKALVRKIVHLKEEKNATRTRKKTK